MSAITNQTVTNHLKRPEHNPTAPGRYDKIRKIALTAIAAITLSFAIQPASAELIAPSSYNTAHRLCKEAARRCRTAGQSAERYSPEASQRIHELAMNCDQMAQKAQTYNEKNPTLGYQLALNPQFAKKIDESVVLPGEMEESCAETAQDCEGNQFLTAICLVAGADGRRLKAGLGLTPEMRSFRDTRNQINRENSEEYRKRMREQVEGNIVENAIESSIVRNITSAQL